MQKLYDLEEDIRLVWSWEIVEIWRLRKDHLYIYIYAYMCVCVRARACVCVCVKSEEGGEERKAYVLLHIIFRDLQLSI